MYAGCVTLPSDGFARPEARSIWRWAFSRSSSTCSSVGNVGPFRLLSSFDGAASASSPPRRFGLSRSHASMPFCRPPVFLRARAFSSASTSSWCHWTSNAYLSLSAAAVASCIALSSASATFHRSATSRPISVNESVVSAAASTSARATLEKYMNALCAGRGAFASFLPSSFDFGFGDAFARLLPSDCSSSLSSDVGGLRCRFPLAAPSAAPGERALSSSSTRSRCSAGWLPAERRRSSCWSPESALHSASPSVFEICSARKAACAWMSSARSCTPPGIALRRRIDLASCLKVGVGSSERRPIARAATTVFRCSVRHRASYGGAAESSL
mmetsp:Transcript_28258/g.70152  ORF Transcript_28258/g.70152 Transcript_28258/m.70152 type:complete len:329 (+) Transcript_28258:59-1045(+)